VPPVVLVVLGGDAGGGLLAEPDVRKSADRRWLGVGF
jgi:hypothetical protein